MFYPEDYLNNKGVELSPIMQSVFLDALTALTEAINKAIKDDKPGWVEKYKYLQTKMINDLKDLGIKVAYGWPGHRNEWFFPTEYDAYMYEDWLVQCSD